MPAPSNYDDYGTVFRIDPTALFGYATTDLPAEVSAIAGSVENIFNVWQGLRSGWFGGSADEAQDFVDRLNTNLRELFGSSGDASSGVLPKIARAIGLAAVNFGETEDVVMRMFDSLTDVLGAPGSPDNPPIRGNNGGPVTENTP